MKLQGILVALTFAVVALAGCADSSDPPAEDPDGTDPAQLQAGKGAISGLVVDDRFRPIPNALVLIQEAGQEATSNENGEFAVIDLNPRTYTVRVSAEGFEATPTQVTVEEGVFTEASLLARRISTADSVIITEEHVGFIPCAFANPVILLTVNCVLDLSGDSFRSSVTVDYSETYGDNITYLVAEVLVNNPGHYSFPLRDSGSGCPCYGRGEIDDDVYGKVILRNDPDEAYDGTSTPWTASERVNIGLFGRGEVQTPEGGVGVYTGVKMRFMVSLFLSEPEVDLEEYSLLQP